MLEIVLCEDNLTQLEYLAFAIENIIKANCIDGKIVARAKGPSEVDVFLKQKTANVFLLDIDLQSNETGYDLAKRIRTQLPGAYIVFITEHLEYTLLGYKTRAFDFLPKPVSENILNKCISDIYSDYIYSKYMNQADTQTISVKFGAKSYYLKKEDILFIEKFKNKSVIHTLNSCVTCYESLESFEKLFLYDKNFIRCHKSYIVNKNHISEVRLNTMEVLFKTGDFCYIGEKYKKNFFGR